MGHGYFTEMKGKYYQYIMDPLTKNQLFNLFSPGFLGDNGFKDYTADTNETNYYKADENVFAAYVMGEFELTNKLRLVGGFRNE